MTQPSVDGGERCGEVYGTTTIGASRIDWHCKLMKGHDGDHQGAQIHAAAIPRCPVCGHQSANQPDGACFCHCEGEFHALQPQPVDGGEAQDARLTRRQRHPIGTVDEEWGLAMAFFRSSNAGLFPEFAGLGYATAEVEARQRVTLAVRADLLHEVSEAQGALVETLTALLAEDGLAHDLSCPSRPATADYDSSRCNGCVRARAHAAIESARGR